MATIGRLRGRRTFTALAQQGRTVRSGPLRVRYLVASGNEAPAVGYAIGKKVGGAVDRNRIRRRLRAVISFSNAPLTSGFYLVSADQSVLGMPFSELAEAWDGAARRVAEVAS